MKCTYRVENVSTYLCMSGTNLEATKKAIFLDPLSFHSGFEKTH